MAGFPHHQLESYLHKLLQQGLRVAVCDQVEDASQAKGLVRREVTRVVTPGTITEDDLLDPKANNHLVAILPTTAAAPTGLAWLDVSTGRVLRHGRDARSAARGAGPARARRSASAPNRTPTPCGDIVQRLPSVPSLAQRPDWTFDPQNGEGSARQAFRRLDVRGLRLRRSAILPSRRRGAAAVCAGDAEDRHGPHSPLAALFRQQGLAARRRDAPQPRTDAHPARRGTPRLLARRHRPHRDDDGRPSLAGMAARAACRSHGHRSPARRRDGASGANASCATNCGKRSPKSTICSGSTSRASTGRALPRDLAAIARTLRFLPTIKAKIAARKSALLRELEASLELCPDLRATLDAALVDDPPLSAKEGGLIKPGYNKELDELRDIARGGKEWITRFQAVRDHAHRHQLAESRLQPGLRLLHRDHAHARRQGPRRLSAQADAEERRALHHAGAQGV